MLTVYTYKSRRSFRSVGRGGGVNEEKSFVVKTEAIGKSQWVESPYLYANEWICANIAQFLRLPIPPFVLVKKKSPDTSMFLSYSFDGDVTPDDAEPDPLYARFPHECTGTVVFDILVMNRDRNIGNIKVDEPLAPKNFYLFDHEKALFFHWKKEGIKRMEQLKDRLGVTDGAASSDEYHCLFERVDCAERISEWTARIRDIPDWFINEICDDVRKISIKNSECDFVKEFLKDRRDNIETLIYNHRHRFPAVKNWGLFV